MKEATPNASNSVAMILRLDTDIKKRLKDEAWMQRTTQSGLLRKITREYLDTRERFRDLARRQHRPVGLLMHEALSEYLARHVEGDGDVPR
jgi:predicted transcriptional regulator